MERLDSPLKHIEAWMSEHPFAPPQRVRLLVVSLDHKAAMRAGFLEGEQMAVVRARDLDALIALFDCEKAKLRDGSE